MMQCNPIIGLSLLTVFDVMACHSYKGLCFFMVKIKANGYDEGKKRILTCIGQNMYGLLLFVPHTDGLLSFFFLCTIPFSEHRW